MKIINITDIVEHFRSYSNFMWGAGGSVCVAGAAWYLLRKRYLNVKKSLPKDGRPLGFMEKMFFEASKIGQLLLSNVLILSSEEKITESSIKETLHHLVQIHPLLGMGVTQINNQLWFVPLENKQLPLQVQSDTDWKKVLEDQLLLPFDEENFLWRVIFLPEVRYNDTDQYQSAVVFAFSHTITDGASYMRLFDMFLTILTNVMKGKPIPIAPLPLIQPMHIYDIIKPTLSERLGSLILYISAKIRPLRERMFEQFVKPARNEFVEKFGTVIAKHPGVKKRTCILPQEFNADITSKLLKECKTRKITVHGAVLAASFKALSELWTEELKEIRTASTVNIRSLLPSKVSQEQMGVYMSVLIYTEQFNNTDDFWMLAGEYSKQLHGMLDRKEYSLFLKMIQSWITFSEVSGYKPPKPDKNNPDRFDSILVFTNLGNCSFLNRPPEAPVKILARYGASAEHLGGSIFANNLATFGGKLFWNVVYYSHITSKEVAEEYAANIREILFNALE